MESYELSDSEKSKFSDEDIKKYETAIEYCGHEHAAGPWGGWARGHEMLQDLGWKEKRVESGRRVFVYLVKPKITPNKTKLPRISPTSRTQDLIIFGLIIILFRFEPDPTGWGIFFGVFATCFFFLSICFDKDEL